MAVKTICPVGMGILVSILDTQTVMGTSLHLSHTVKQTGESPQGRILALGPKLAQSASEYGLEVGQRVVLTGTFTPMPKCSEYENEELAIVDWTAIKSILVEQ